MQPPNALTANSHSMPPSTSAYAATASLLNKTEHAAFGTASICDPEYGSTTMRAWYTASCPVFHGQDSSLVQNRVFGTIQVDEQHGRDRSNTGFRICWLEAVQ